MNASANYPILYSFRRCPYAIRARLALAQAGVCVILREVQLRQKPAELLAVSPKATVPVLVLPDGQVIEQSLDIMLWALKCHDPEQWLKICPLPETQAWLTRNDTEFKYWLDRYKYADRYPQQTATYYRQQGEAFLQALEQQLALSDFLSGDQFGLLDAAIVPFVRQFASVEPDWFAHCAYPGVRAWLQAFLASARFQAVMANYPVWQPGSEPILFAPTPIESF